MTGNQDLLLQILSARLLIAPSFPSFLGSCCLLSLCLFCSSAAALILKACQWVFFFPFSTHLSKIRFSVSVLEKQHAWVAGTPASSPCLALQSTICFLFLLASRTGVLRSLPTPATFHLALIPRFALNSFATLDSVHVCVKTFPYIPQDAPTSFPPESLRAFKWAFVQSCLSISWRYHSVPVDLSLSCRSRSPAKSYRLRLSSSPYLGEEGLPHCSLGVREVLGAVIHRWLSEGQNFWGPLV